MVQDTPSPLPVYDIDEILANLTLEENSDREVEPQPRRLPTSARSSKPGKPTLKQPRPLSNERPVTPPRQAQRDTDPPPYSTPTLYRFSSPAKSGITADWSEAGHATKAGGSVHAVHKAPKRRGTKAAYVVFRGRSIGVKRTWEEVDDATTAFRFALQQGYKSFATAEAAFQHALEKGWTSSASDWAALPISISSAPLPIANDAASLEIANREPDDPWYVVYAGVNPGIFPNNLECALNVLGIRGSRHESVRTLAEAQAKFARATDRGEVSIERRRVV
ncbi:hypothetical protein B0H11DRAFT_2260906 [Mycena galericulata]|nr:hypothetical protein B0H11DRAFT_2260906 [Mycena galericulata]